jgi:hypothetical protein
MIPATLTIPQWFGLWHRQRLAELPPGLLLDNDARKSFGLKPLKEGLPSCATPITR